MNLSLSIYHCATRTGLAVELRPLSNSLLEYSCQKLHFSTRSVTYCKDRVTIDREIVKYMERNDVLFVTRVMSMDRRW